MAVLVQFAVAPATQEQFNELDVQVGQAMTDAGGPPDGLMSHVVYPDGDGFVVADVWRTAADGEVVLPLIARQGLTAGETDIRPAWSFARP